MKNLINHISNYLNKERTLTPTQFVTAHFITAIVALGVSFFVLYNLGRYLI